MKQFLLFEEPLEGKLLREVAELKESISRVRKGQFAKIGELGKLCKELSDRLTIIEQGLCKAALQDDYEVHGPQSSKVYEFCLL